MTFTTTLLSVLGLALAIASVNGAPDESPMVSSVWGKRTTETASRPDPTRPSTNEAKWPMLQNLYTVNPFAPKPVPPPPPPDLDLFGDGNGTSAVHSAQL